MNVVILEDEAPARRLLERWLAELRPDWKLAASLDSLAAARDHFASSGADLVLSDIRLSDGSALALFEDGTIDSPVVFVTAYDAYLVAAFAHLSVDYLLKPLERDALARALDKFERMRRRFGKSEAGESASLLRLPRRRVLVRHKSDTRALPVDEVAFFRSDDKLTLAVDRSGKEFVVDRTLGQLEAELDRARFFRANRAFLVQVSSIVSFKSGGRGRIVLQLAPSPVDEVVVSQENAAAFRDFVDR